MALETFRPDYPPARILHLASADHGGAGTASVRLHQALLKAGAASRMIVWDRHRTDEGIVSASPKALAARLKHLSARAWSKFFTKRQYFFQDQRLSANKGTNTLDEARAFRPDLIVAHYISNFLSFDDLLEIQGTTGAHVVFNMMDMAPFTGGCHYAWDCAGYTRSCGACPALPLRPPEDASAKTIRTKRAVLEDLRFSIVVGSSTLRSQVAASSLFSRADVHLAPLGIDELAFPFVERGEARARLGLSAPHRILFVGVQNFTDRRKGMFLLAGALERLALSVKAADRPLLLVAGDTRAASEFRRLGFPVHALGYVGQQELALAYAATDFFVCPSIEDSGPMMVNESLMAGTPVIAFQTGVVPDLVLPGQTGLIALEKNAKSLCASLLDALGWSAARHAQARLDCRRLAREKCSLENQASVFLDLTDEKSK